MNDCNYWGDAVKNEDDKKNVTLKIIRLGLYGSLYDLGNIPTIETFHHWLSQAEKTVTHHKREEITPDENEENDG